MNRYFLVALSIVAASSLSAQSIQVQVNTTASFQTYNVTASGSAQFLNALGQPVSVGMSGNLSTYESGATLVIYSPWWAPSGSWQGSSGTYGYANTCYESAVVAQSAGLSVTQWSSSACTGFHFEPNHPHGTDICPLILDLNGDGIRTTGSEAPVTFQDVNHDGQLDLIGWTHPETDEAFLWLDVNRNQSFDVGELFGTGMALLTGGTAPNGYRALELYDLAQYGGNGDGVIDRQDAVWKDLLLWIDSDHDGATRPGEIRTLMAEHIVSLSLTYEKVHKIDGAGNALMLVGTYQKYENPTARHGLLTRRMADILFQTFEP